MIRYLVFAFENYYPGGGSDDLIGVAESREVAERIAEKYRRTDNVEIFDTLTGAVRVGTVGVLYEWAKGFPKVGLPAEAFGWEPTS